MNKFDLGTFNRFSNALSELPETDILHASITFHAYLHLLWLFIYAVKMHSLVTDPLSESFQKKSGS